MTTNNLIEIDFLPVGSDTRSGDAIAMRFGNYQDGKWNNQKVFITDGGNSDSGEDINI